VDPASPDLRTYWELPSERRRRLLRWNLLEVLALVTEGEIGPDEFAQELALQLSRLPETVLFENGRFRNLKHRKRFHATQKKTFLALLAPYRWKKRNERVVPYSDGRWQDDPEKSDGRILVRRLSEFRHHGAVQTSCNRQEQHAAALVDFVRAWETLEGSYPEPVVLAAIGVISRSQAIAELKMRRSVALALIREARERLAALELPE
jgi:hypothetical protein